jgi:AraC family transcriptional regulator
VIAGIRGTTTFYNNSLPKLWSQYMKMCRIHNMNTIGYSIYESHNASYLENDDLRFSVMIGSPIEAFLTVPKSFEKKTLSKGKYAVFTHTGSLQNLVLSYDYIYGVWAMSSKFQLDNRESYEIYDGQVREYTDADNYVLIYIPIK